MVNNIAKFFAILATAMFLVTPVAAVDFADENFSIKIDVDTRHPTLGKDLEFNVQLENLDAELDFKEIKTTIWITDEDGKKVGEKIEDDFSKLSQTQDRDNDYVWQIPGDIDEGDYTINVEVEGQWQNAAEPTTYTATAEIGIERQEHSLVLDKVELSNDVVKAGNPLDVAVTILNAGEKDERDVKIRLDIFALSISNEIQLTSDLLDGRDIDQYMSLEIPADAKAGKYDLAIKVYNGNANDEAVKQITVEEADPAKKDSTDNTVRSNEILTPGKATIISLQVINHDNEKKTLTFDILDVDWGEARIDPITVTLDANEETIVYAHIIPDKDASGKKTFTFVVKDGKTIVDSTDFEVNIGSKLASDSAATNLLIVFILGLLIYFFWQTQAKRS